MIKFDELIATILSSKPKAINKELSARELKPECEKQC